MAHSDGWNCLYSLDTETQLVQTVANTIIQNTSGPKEADDFWSRAELNLLMALIHYVCNLRDEKGNLCLLYTSTAAASEKGRMAPKGSPGGTLNGAARSSKQKRGSGHGK